MTEVKKPTVLVVDDEPQVINLNTRVLTRGGFDCVGNANSGNQALSQLKTVAEPDAIVCDLDMPDGNGKFLHDELIRQGRQTLAGRIFFVSGGANGKLQEFYDEMQTKGRLLQKPFRPEELITAVRKILLQIELQ